MFNKYADRLILVSILAVFALSTFADSDVLGVAASISVMLTLLRVILTLGLPALFRNLTTGAKDKMLKRMSAANLWLLAYFMLVVVSLAGSTLFALSLQGFVKTVIYLAFYVSVAHYLKTNRDKIPLILGAIGVCAFSQAIIAIMQNFVQVGPLSTWQDVSKLNPEQIMTRVYGTLKPFNPNLLGGYLLCCLPALLGLCAVSRRSAVIWGLPALLTSVAIFATGCRGAYLGFAAVLVIVFALAARHLDKRIVAGAAAAAVAAISAAIACSSSLRARVLSIFAMRQDSSNSFRFNVYQSSFEMFKDNWLLGIGVGNKNFREIYGLYMKTGFDALSAYNIFLEIAVESGVFALVAFVGFLVVTIRKALKSKEIFVMAALVSVCACLVHGLVDTVFFRPQIQFVFWTMAAIITAEKD